MSELDKTIEELEAEVLAELEEAEDPAKKGAAPAEKSDLKDESEEIKPFLAGKIIDTTGAGDLYAGGFIHGLINNYSIKKCGEIGSICAGHIITQLGSRSNINLQNLLRANLI